MTYTDEEINEWPSDSYAGKERDLADMMNDAALDYYETIMDYDNNEWNFAAFSLFTLLMMDVPCYLMLTESPRPDNWYEARRELIDDANENSGEYFAARMDQRVGMRQTLRRLGDDLTKKLSQE